jgi:hypothetical protein
MMVAVLTLTPLAQAAELKLTNPALEASAGKLEKELVAKYGDQARARLHRGLAQAGSLWRDEDGDAAAFESFVRENFAGDQKTHDELFTRLEYLFEQLDGHLLEINREFRMQADVEKGGILPADEIFAAYDPFAHVNDDFFKNKMAFVVLLNFPLTTLEERISEGRNWSRRQWAEARLAQRFARRIPAQVNLEISEATSAADRYISAYNIWMHHLLDEKGQRLFPEKLRLISHWNLRDELKGNYSEKNGIVKQRMIQQVMERIVTQTIPEAVVDNPTVDWKPYSNTVTASNVKDYETAPADAKPASNSPEPNTRYAMLLNNFKALRKADPYSPTAPTAIERSFEDVREIPEARVKAMFEKVLTSPMVPQVAKLIEKRLGRKLEPFDIWYSGFRARGQYTEAQLDEITRKKYPTAEAYRDDMKNLFVKLGFSPERAAYLMDKIEVHPSRGAGHAFGAAMKGEKAYLRTRVESAGMDYKGYNIAVHEMGHNVEQTFSLYDVDHWFLQGVPNTAFTEALAFVFQNKDLELLGLSKADEQTRALKVLDDFWGTYEIAGVALVDVAVWHWMYEHPDATPAQLRDATVQIAKDTWNRYYAPVFGKRDVVLLGVYSHMIDNPIYLPNYPIGHLIALQIEEHMEKEGKIGPEFERMARIGSIAPDIWMEKATGAPVGPDAMLHATERALKTVK